MHVYLMPDLFNPELYVPRRSFSPVGTAELARLSKLAEAKAVSPV
jgi:hypothetical protein